MSDPSPVKSPKSCCATGLGLVGAISPFDWVIILEYGERIPITGVARCGSCGSSWKFSYLDGSDRAIIYLLSSLTSGSFQRLVDGFSTIAKPMKPSWLPPTEQAISSEKARTLNDLEESVLARSFPATVLATKNLINGKILATADPDVNVKDWFSRMRLKR